MHRARPMDHSRPRAEHVSKSSLVCSIFAGHFKGPWVITTACGRDHGLVAASAASDEVVASAQRRIWHWHFACVVGAIGDVVVDAVRIVGVWRTISLDAAVEPFNPPNRQPGR